MVNNKVFWWPTPLFFMVLGAHGSYSYDKYSTCIVDIHIYDIYNVDNHILTV